MKKTYFLTSLLCVGLATSMISCKREKTGEPQGVVLNSNTADLDKRLTTYQNEVVPVVDYGDQKVAGSKRDNQISSIDISSDYNLRLIAHVEAPEYNGSTLQATEVAVSGNLAYVSYNTQGNVYLGGVDVLDITDGSKPKLLQSAITPNIDINSLTIDNNNLFIAGALDIDQFSDYKYPAIVSRISINGGLLTENITKVKLGGQVANSISIDGNNLFVASGNANGGVSIIDKNDLSIKHLISLEGAKDVAIGANDYTVLFGAFSGSSKQSLAIYDKASNKLKTSSDVPTGIAHDAKSNIALANNSVLLSNGKAGITFWNPVSNVRIDYIGLPTSITGIADEEIYTNSVSVSDNYVYGANGSAGLVVSQINTAGSGLEILGIADVKGSANYVKAAKGLIFVASGKAGVQIYKLENKVVQPPVSTDPSCGNRPILSSNNNGTYTNNPKDKEFFKGTTVLSGLNVMGLFDFCGSLKISKHLNVNGTGLLKVTGPLTVENALNVNSIAKVSGNITAGSLTNKGELEMLQSGTLKVLGDMSLDKGSVLKVRGNLQIDGDFNFNGGSIEFIGTGNTVLIKGKVKGDGTIVGDYSGTIK